MPLELTGSEGVVALIVVGALVKEVFIAVPFVVPVNTNVVAGKNPFPVTNLLNPLTNVIADPATVYEPGPTILVEEEMLPLNTLILTAPRGVRTVVAFTVNDTIFTLSLLIPELRFNPRLPPIIGTD